MIIRMVSNSVLFLSHFLNNISMKINFSANEKKSCFHLILVQDLKNFSCLFTRAIIKSESNFIVLAVSLADGSNIYP